MHGTKSSSNRKTNVKKNFPKKDEKHFTIPLALMPFLRLNIAGFAIVKFVGLKQSAESQWKLLGKPILNAKKRVSNSD